MLISLVCLSIQCKRFECFVLKLESMVNLINFLSKQTQVTKDDFLNCELSLLENLNYEFCYCTIFEFIEMHSACFWTLISKRLNMEVSEFKKAIDRVVDVLLFHPKHYCQQRDPILLSSSIIVCSSLIVTGRNIPSLLAWRKYLRSCIHVGSFINMRKVN